MPFDAQTTLADGRVELNEGVTLDDPALASHDFAPTRVSDRTWTTYSFAALWVSMAHCIPTYMMASGLIDQGMNWWQALATILVGNVIVLLPILANSHPGTKYGIPFPVFARASYGVFGANVPALMRAVVACGWFGIQCWIGGQALDTLFRSISPGWETLLGTAMAKCEKGVPCTGLPWLTDGHRPTEFVAFALFWLLNVGIVYRGMEVLRKVENWAAPYVLIMTGVLVAWAIGQAHGLGAVVRNEGKFASLGAFFPVFVPNVTAMIGFWATLSLNMPDFTRFGRSQREQAFGQVVALPTTMTVFSAMGVVITSAATEIYGKPIWDPVELVGHFSSRLIVAIAMFTVVVATLSVNIAANVVSPANDFANVKPGKISFKTGGLITGILGVLMLPWKLIADPTNYIFDWLIAYSGGLGAIAGVLVADYWVIRKKELDLRALYRRDGIYAYGSKAGTNPAAIVATLAGAFMAWIGRWVSSLSVLFHYAWFVGTGVAALVYLALMWNRRLMAAPQARDAS
jgi:NCS1 family nucleobase:cation symporter-1